MTHPKLDSASHFILIVFVVHLQEYLVSHIHSSLEQRVVPEAIDQMKAMRKNVMFEMERELGPTMRVECVPNHWNSVLAGEQDLDCPADDKSVRAKYGYQLFSKFMTYLTGDESLWRDTAPCIRHSDSAAAASKARAKKKAKAAPKEAKTKAVKTQAGPACQKPLRSQSLNFPPKKLMCCVSVLCTVGMLVAGGSSLPDTVWFVKDGCYGSPCSGGGVDVCGRVHIRSWGLSYAFIVIAHSVKA